VELFDIVEGQRLKMRAARPWPAVDVVSALQIEDAENGHTPPPLVGDQRRERHRSERRRPLEGTARRLTELF
jgi:hypothetical protein